MELFTSYGYERVKPPMVEYEGSLLAPGPGAALAADTFRLMDPQSHKMLGIRSDITPQISRIARSRYEKTARPLRLAYANDVLRMRGGQDRFARQFCKVGAEIVGDEGLDAFIECAVLAVQGLHTLGVQDISIDLALPRLVDQLFAEHKVKGALAERLTDALDRRAADGWATGFTLYMDSVRAALPPLKKRDVLAVPYGVSWGDIRDLQEQGWIIVRSREKDVSKTATHRYKGGEIHKI